MIASWWDRYWNLTGGNVLAMPLQAVVTVAATLLLRKPIKRAFHRAVGEHADIEDIRRAATAAHQIAADLFEHHTGAPHRLAPDPGERERE